MVDSKENYKLGPGRVKGCDTVLAPQNNITLILHDNNRSNELKPVFRLFSVVSVVVFILT